MKTDPICGARTATWFETAETDTCRRDNDSEVGNDATNELVSSPLDGFTSDTDTDETTVDGPSDDNGEPCVTTHTTDALFPSSDTERAIACAFDLRNKVRGQSYSQRTTRATSINIASSQLRIRPRPCHFSLVHRNTKHLISIQCNNRVFQHHQTRINRGNEMKWLRQTT